MEAEGQGMKASEIFDLKGRVAMVTGASSGLGTRFAQVMAANGAAVALVARRVDRLKDVQQKIEGAGGKAIAVEGDVLDRASMTRAFDQIEKALGAVTILVNNAGVAHSTRAMDVTEEEWRRVVGTNLDAVFYNAQDAAKRMLAAGKKGAIVNIASVLGFGVSKGTVAYSTAKAGVIQMTKALGLELAFKGVRVNAIAPGWFVTDMNSEAFDQARVRERLLRDVPMRRTGNLDEIGPLVVYLASSASSYMTGQTVFLDGGHSAA
jgi:NAD(P)-dependent dehydrogenase (short-subunit alcohol dehydrogenase family)